MSLDFGSIDAALGISAAAGAAVATWWGVGQGIVTAQKRRERKQREASLIEANAEQINAKTDIMLAGFLRGEIDRIKTEANEARLKLEEELETMHELVDVLEKRLHDVTLDRDIWRGRAVELGWRALDSGVNHP